MTAVDHSNVQNLAASPLVEPVSDLRPGDIDLSDPKTFLDHGLKETLRARDEPFGEGFARVGQAEGRSSAVRAAREGNKP